MVSDVATALRALHQALVAARNLGLERPRTVAEIVDYLECVPLWIVDPAVDRTLEIVERFRLLADEYPECRLAANTAAQLLPK